MIGREIWQVFKKSILNELASVVEKKIDLMGLIVEDLRNIAKFCNQMYKLPETGMFWYSNEYNVLQCKEITNKKRQN